MAQICKDREKCLQIIIKVRPAPHNATHWGLETGTVETLVCPLNPLKIESRPKILPQISSGERKLDKV